MFTRSLTLPTKRSCLLLGPRQTGKSTLVRAALPTGALSIDLLHHDSFLRYAREPALLRREALAYGRSGGRTIFIDEVQKVPELLDEVHGLIEDHGLRFVLTGSSARKLRRRGTNLLAGRASVRHLHPLTTDELGDAFELDRVLRLGSLPAVASATEEDARELLRSYAETYLQEEIRAEALVRNVGGFARFLDVAAADSGGLVNFTSIARDVAIAARSVQEYYRILEDTLLGFRLEPWARSPRARMVAHPKFYLFDTGVTNALLRRLTAPPDPAQCGRLFEQLVVLECRRRMDYAQSEAKLWFWRTHTGAEVDLLIEKHGRLRVAIEIKSGRVSGADLAGLRSFAQAHPKVPRVVVSNAERAYCLGDTDVLPLATFLARLPRWI